jgi:hypothetical protein
MRTARAFGVSLCSIVGLVTILLCLNDSSSAETSPAQDAMHEVQPGDDLRLLADYYYRDAQLWERIWQANRDKIRNPSRLERGTLLLIPDATSPSESYADFVARVRGPHATVEAPPTPTPPAAKPAKAPIPRATAPSQPPAATPAPLPAPRGWVRDLREWSSYLAKKLPGFLFSSGFLRWLGYIAFPFVIFLDGVRNQIGRVPGGGLLNYSPGGWATFAILFPIVGPLLYLVRRSRLIENSHDLGSKRKGKIIFGSFLTLSFAGAFLSWTIIPEILPFCGRLYADAIGIAEEETGEKLRAVRGKPLELTSEHGVKRICQVKARNAQGRERTVTYSVRWEDKEERTYIIHVESQ